MSCSRTRAGSNRIILCDSDGAIDLAPFFGMRSLEGLCNNPFVPYICAQPLPRQIIIGSARSARFEVIAGNSAVYLNTSRCAIEIYNMGLGSAIAFLFCWLFLEFGICAWICSRGFVLLAFLGAFDICVSRMNGFVLQAGIAGTETTRNRTVAILKMLLNIIQSSFCYSDLRSQSYPPPAIAIRNEEVRNWTPTGPHVLS